MSRRRAQGANVDRPPPEVESFEVVSRPLPADLEARFGALAAQHPVRIERLLKLTPKDAMRGWEGDEH